MDCSCAIALNKIEGREQKEERNRSDSCVSGFVHETFPFCVFSEVPGPVEKHTELAGRQLGGNPCYSSHFAASNMQLGARLG